MGLPGPRNEPCWPPASTCDNGVMDGDESSIDCGGSCKPCEIVGSACTTRTDCFYGLCTRDALLGSVCAAPVKPCPNNCTGHGSCVHSDITGARIPAIECTSDVWSCSATCVCRYGWYGDDCASDEFAWAEIIALRNGMLGSLTDATGMQDLSADALNQQASSLSSLAANPSQLAGGGEFAALDLVGNIAGSSEDVGLAAGTDGTVGNTLSNLLSSGLIASNQTFNVTTYAPTFAPSQQRHPSPLNHNTGSHASSKIVSLPVACACSGEKLTLDRATGGGARLCWSSN